MELNIPAWAQQITLFIIMLCSGIVGIWRYFRTETDKVKGNKLPDTSVVTAASFVETKLLRELIDTLREHSEEIGRHSQRITRSQGELRETLIEAIEVIHVNTNAVLNMTRFITRQDQLNK